MMDLEMDNNWNRATWSQFGAAIDMLHDAMVACPDELWTERLWGEPADRPDLSAFWYLAYHALFYVDLYLTGSVEGFAPPPPFTLSELDPAGVLPDRVYTKAELLSYLQYGRDKCRSTIEALTDESARRQCKFSWMQMSFSELLIYNMRHVQEHAAQLNLFLGQKVGGGGGWVGKARK